uniref:Binder of sperm protein homolog 2 n=1 Tax=Mus musculus TaxID=10090 RepID=A0A0J9YV67_MOUSE
MEVMSHLVHWVFLAVYMYELNAELISHLHPPEQVVSPSTVTMIGVLLTFNSKEGGGTVQHRIPQSVFSLSNSNRSSLRSAPRRAIF